MGTRWISMAVESRSLYEGSRRDSKETKRLKIKTTQGATVSDLPDLSDKDIAHDPPGNRLANYTHDLYGDYVPFTITDMCYFN